MVARLRITEKRIREVSFLPAHINEKNQPVLATAADSGDVVQHVRQASQRFGTRFRLDGDAVVVETADT